MAEKSPSQEKLLKYVGLSPDYPANLAEQDAIKFIYDRTEAEEGIEAPQYDVYWNLANQGGDYEVNETRWKELFPDEDYPAEKADRTNLAVLNKLEDASIDFMNDPESEARADSIWEKRDRLGDLLKRQMEGLYEAYHGATDEKTIEFKKELNALRNQVDANNNAHQFTVDIDHLSLTHPFFRELREKADAAKSDKQLEALNITVDDKTDKRTVALPNSKKTDLRATTTNPAEARYLWEQSNTVGDSIIDEKTGKTHAMAELELFLMRVKGADIDNREKYGDDVSKYKDPYEWALEGREIDKKSLVNLTNETEKATRPVYQALLDQLDQVAVDRFGIDKADARKSWFQTDYGKFTNQGNLKKLVKFDPNQYFVGIDVEKTLMNTAKMQGMEKEMKTLLDNSHYYRNGEKRNSLYYDPQIDKGKDQGAFALSDVNPPKPGRMLSDLDPKRKDGMYDGIKTMNHETGHGNDYTQIAEALPKALKGIHTTTTESHAFLQEELMTNRDWLLNAVVDADGKPLFNEQTVDEYLEQAVPFSQMDTAAGYRATMALMDFERQAYEHLYGKHGAKSGNGDKEATAAEKDALVQDLNKLWWDSREKFMLEEKPQGKDAEKPAWTWLPHYVGSVAYYPNYFQAELLRAMKLKHIDENKGGLLTPEAREWLGDSLKTGNLKPWNDIVESRLGEPLNVNALKEEYKQIEVPTWKENRTKQTKEDLQSGSRNAFQLNTLLAKKAGNS